MSKKDYYSVLGIAKSATQDEIKQAYRAMVKEHHPDKNHGDKNAEHKFKEINEAYEVLKDPEKRSSYDMYGSSAFEPGGWGGRGPSHSSSSAGQAGFEDFFADIFGNFMGAKNGRKSKATTSIPGSDIRYDLTITLEEAFLGKKISVKYNTAVKCDDCSGAGSQNANEYIKCVNCGGHGAVRMQQGFSVVESACNTCSGSGKVLKTPCKKCHGQGRVSNQKDVSVSIPPGVDNETKIRIAGEGEAGIRGGASGNLYIFISIKKHKIFERKGNNLHYSMPIKMTTAALGGQVNILCIDGNSALLSIPEGTQNGTIFKISGKGMPIIKSQAGFGDLYAEVSVEIPVKLNLEQKQLLENFEKISMPSSNPKSEGFFKKFKDMWK